MAKSNTRARSSVIGRYVTKAYAKNHPRTTEIEKTKAAKRKGKKIS